MTLAAPLFAWLAGAVALATVALHLLAWRRPPESPLPTARFAPERPIRTVSRAVRPADLALLALRVALILLVGVALAGPEFPPSRDGTARVIVVDRSRNVGNVSEVERAARSLFRTGDAVVVFDSAAAEFSGRGLDSIMVGRPDGAPGSLSTALVVASRVARRLVRERDSVTIVIVSPFATDELDAATADIRRTWPGPIQLVRSGALPNDTVAPAPAEVRAARGDPVSAALALAGPLPNGRVVRVVRDSVTSADTAWARSGNALVVWPTQAPGDWRRRPSADTALGVSAIADGPVRGATVVAEFPRTTLPPGGRVVARWSDGDPAATESSLGAGCVRSIAVAVPSAGDLALTPAFRRFAQHMASGCGGDARVVALSDTALATVIPPSLPASEGLEVPAANRSAPRSPLIAWLLGLALAAAVAELFVRRGESHATA